MRMTFSFLMFLLGLSLCAADQPKEQIPDIDAIKESGNLGKCSVSVGSVYCWRDWQPVVEKPGADGGSPLYIKSNLQIDNSTGSTGRISWESYVLDVETHEFHLVELVDKKGAPKWDGRISDSEVKESELMTHDGPYLAVGRQVILVFHLKDQSGRILWLKSKKVQIKRTD